MKKFLNLYMAWTLAAVMLCLSACSPSSVGAAVKPAESAAKEAVESAAASVAVSAAESAAESVAEAASLPASEIFNAVKEQVGMDDVMELPPEYVMNYYGIDTEEVSDSFFAVSEESTSAETVIFARTDSKEQADKVEETLNNILEQKAEETENYLPDQYQIVSKSQVRRAGDTVYLIISDHEDEIRAIIESAL